MSTDVRVVENVTPYLRVVGDRLRDLAPALAPLVDELHDYFGEQFETAGAAGGSPWAPLALATVLGKADPRPLINRGTLERSLVERGATPFSYVDLGRDHVAVGTTDPKALYVNAKRDIVGDPGERRVERWADALAERLLGD